MKFKEWMEKHKPAYQKVDTSYLLNDNEIYGEARIELYELDDVIVEAEANNRLWVIWRK